MLGLVKTEAKDVDSLFDSWDTDKSGSLGISELTRFLTDVPASPSLASISAHSPPISPNLAQSRPHQVPDLDGPKNKMVIRKGLTRRGSALGNVDLLEDSDQPVQEQLRDILIENAVRVIDLFKEWDEDGDGTVSKKEFRRAMPMLGLELPRQDVDALYDSWDPDGSGSITLKELERVLKAPAAGRTEEAY